MSDTPNNEEYIFDEEEEALEILEDAGVPSEVNDKIVAIIRKLCEDLYGGEDLYGED